MALPFKAQHAITYDPVRQRVVMFGGRDPAPGGYGVSPEVWEWDGTTWTTRPTSPDPTIALANSPTGRWDHGLAYDRQRNALVTHGGYYLLQGSNGFGETWELTADGVWRLRAVAPNVVEGLYYGLIGPDHPMTYDWDRGVTLLSTRAFENGQHVGHLWEWTGSSWTVRATLPWRENAGMAYDDVRKRTAIVAGAFGNFSHADVWEWRYFDAPPFCPP